MVTIIKMQSSGQRAPCQGKCLFGKAGVSCFLESDSEILWEGERSSRKMEELGKLGMPV